MAVEASKEPKEEKSAAEGKHHRPLPGTPAAEARRRQICFLFGEFAFRLRHC